VPILLAGVLLSCSHEAKESDAVVSVDSAMAVQKTLQRTVTADAILYPLHQAALVPKISAPVTKFYIHRGSHVRRGQLLAVLENRDLSAGAEQSKGEYEQAQASYATATAATVPEEVQKAQLEATAAKQSLEAEEKVYLNRKNLYEQGALPRKELDQAAVALTQARNQYEIAQRHLQALLNVGRAQELKAAQGQLTAAQGKYKNAAAQLSYSEIRSPIDGVVTDRPLYAGEMATAGTSLLTVMDISRVIAKSHIPESEARLLKPGDRATISLSGESEPVQAKVTIVSPALDPGSTTLEVWVEAANPQDKLKPGSAVKISVMARSIPDAVVIPAGALLTDHDGSTAVMVVGTDGRAHRREVKTGIRENNEIQIVDGVKSGERVVTAGAYGLPDNTRVQLASST
jgi:multidrug efflux pump subunit AcrA (membrane-fusion protein)